MRGVASERYILNKRCAHPECSEPAADAHHAFPRSAIGGDSWFVEITEPYGGEEPNEHGFVTLPTIVIPHVTGLCRAHHHDVEEHRAWIKLDGGTWSWWVRDESEGWIELGLLNPQPGSQEGKPKRRKRKGTPGGAKRVNISFHVPVSEQENGAELLDELIDQLEERIRGDDEHRSPYYTLADALSYALLNSDRSDFV